MERPENNINSKDPAEAVIDVSSDEIIDSLSGEQKKAVLEHESLFKKLASKPSSKHGNILKKYREDNPDVIYEETQKVKQAVDDLRKQYS